MLSLYNYYIVAVLLFDEIKIYYLNWMFDINLMFVIDINYGIITGTLVNVSTKMRPPRTNIKSTECGCLKTTMTATRQCFSILQSGAPGHATGLKRKLHMPKLLPPLKKIETRLKTPIFFSVLFGVITKVVHFPRSVQTELFQCGNYFSPVSFNLPKLLQVYNVFIHSKRGFLPCFISLDTFWYLDSNCLRIYLSE